MAFPGIKLKDLEKGFGDFINTVSGFFGAKPQAQAAPQPAPQPQISIGPKPSVPTMNMTPSQMINVQPSFSPLRQQADNLRSVVFKDQQRPSPLEALTAPAVSQTIRRVAPTIRTQPPSMDQQRAELVQKFGIPALVNPIVGAGLLGTLGISYLPQKQREQVGNVLTTLGGEQTQSFNERLYGGKARELIRTGEFLIPGDQSKQAEALISRVAPEPGTEAIKRSLTPQAKPESFGGKLGTAAKAATDIVTMVVPTTAASKALTALPLVQKGLRAGPLARTGTIAAREAIAGIPGTLAYVSQQIGGKQKVDLKKELAIGAAADVLLNIITRGAAKAWRGAKVKLASPVVSDLAKTTDANQVNNILKNANIEFPTNIKNVVATRIAQSQNPTEIKSILRQAAGAADNVVAQQAAKTAVQATPTIKAPTTTVEPLGEFKPKIRPEKTGIQLTNKAKLYPDELAALQSSVAGQQQATIRANARAIELNNLLKSEGGKESINTGVDSFIKLQRGEYANTRSGQILRNAFDDALMEARQAGFDVKYLDNYLPQIWKQNDSQIGKLLQRKGIQTTPGFQNSRLINSYEEGLALKLKPKYKDVAQLYGAYIQQLETAKANMQMINNLNRSRMLAVGGNVPEGWKQIPIPGFNINGQPLYGDPRIVQVLKDIYGTDQGLASRGLQRVAGFNSLWQNIVLSGGIPYTPANMFVFGQMFKETATGTGGILGLLKGDTRGISRFGTYADLIRSFSPNAVRAQQLANEDLILGMAKNGTQIRFANFIDRPSGLRRAIDEPTFGRFLPLIELRTGRTAYNEAIKKGLSQNEAYKIAAETVKAYHGASNAIYNLRSQDAQNLITATLLAPQYRESLVNVYAETAKAFVPGSGRTKSLNRYMAAGLGITFLAYNALNRLLNDDKNMWENEPGKELSLQIPYGEPDERGVRKAIFIPFAPSLLTIPRNVIEAGTAFANKDTEEGYRKLLSNASIPIQTLNQIITNKDFAGRPIYVTDEISAQTGKPIEDPYIKSVEHLAKQGLFPSARAAYEYFIQKKPGGQAIATALELPVRYGKVNTEASRSYFKTREQELRNASPDARRRYTDRHTKDVGTKPFYTTVKKASDMIGANGTLTEDYYLEKAIATREGGKYGYDPLYDLPDNQAFVVLKLQQLQGSARNDASVKQIKANNPWLQDFYDRRSDYFDTIKIAEEDKLLPKYPEPSTQLQGKLEQYNNLSKDQKGAFLKANPDIAQFFDESFDYTNEVRRMQGVPEFAKRPQPTPEVQRKLDEYNTLSKGTGARSRFLRANPDVVDFFNKIKLFNESGPFGTGVFAGGGGTNQTMEQILAEIQRTSTGSRRSTRRFNQPFVSIQNRRVYGVKTPRAKLTRPTSGGKVIVRTTKA